MLLIARFYLKYCALFSKGYSFISLSFNRINPAEMPIFYKYSTSDQPVFVRKALPSCPPFCFPEYAETVRLHSGTLLDHRSGRAGDIHFNRTLRIKSRCGRTLILLAVLIFRYHYRFSSLFFFFQYWLNFNIEDGGQACVWVIISFLFVFLIFFKTSEKYMVQVMLSWPFRCC